MVTKRRNIDSVDLVDNKYQIELPISRPTEMSYFLQRIRMAEISRSIVDHNPIAVISSGGPSYSVHVMAMDFELDQMIHDIPLPSSTSTSTKAIVILRQVEFSSRPASSTRSLHPAL